MTSIETAIQELQRKGYEAKETTLGMIQVQDPVAVRCGSKSWTEYEARTIHPDRVWHFLVERC